jgi:hypothetical protein
MQLKELGVIIPTEPHSNISSAINAAQQAPGAAVWIPAWYTGGDSVPATNVPVIDMRGNAGTFTGGFSPGVFSFANYGAIDDDVTDNCPAVTAFNNAVNSYSGPGVPVAIIAPGSANKAYKLATANCTFAFTNPKGATIHLWANIDCQQTAQSCIQLGPANVSGGAVAYPVQQSYTLDGYGALLGGQNLTTAGVYVEPQVVSFYIDGIRFLGTGPASGGGQVGFGATNSTLGNCTNYAIYVDNPVAGGVISNVYASVNATDSTHGGCGFANPNGAAAGSNTVQFSHNIIGTAGFVGGVGNCGSVGILDGGTLGSMIDNVIYGFGMNVRLQGLGHRILGNELDAANCSAKGVSSIVHVGANGSSTPITQVMVSNNIVQVGGGHTTNFLAIAGDSTCPTATCLQDWSITGNITNTPSPGNLIAGTPSCVSHLTSNGCYIAGNQNFNSLVAPSSTQTGWAMGLSFVGSKSLVTQAANVGSTLVINAPITRTYLVVCQVISTNTPTGATLPACNLSYTDLNSGVAATPAVTSTASVSAPGTVQSGTAAVTIAAGGAINFTTTGYAAGSGTALQYAVNVFVYSY